MESCRKGVPGGGNSICKGLEEGEEDGGPERHRVGLGVAGEVTLKS